MLTTTQAEQVLETMLLCAGRRLTTADLVHLFNGQFAPVELDKLLADVGRRWEHMGISLDAKPGSWGVTCKAEMLPYLRRLHSAGTINHFQDSLEILTIIAYRQPITRPQIAEMRGRPVTREMLEELMSRGWIASGENAYNEPVYQTTEQFLRDFRIQSLSELPARFEAP